MVVADGLGVTKSGREGIAKNESLVEKMPTLQKPVTDEQAARKVLEDELENLKNTVSAFEKLVVKLEESDKLLEALCTEVVSLKEQVARAAMERVELKDIVLKVHQGPEQCLVRLNIARLGWSRVLRLTTFLVAESVNAINTVV